jgi:hypothetical protein
MCASARGRRRAGHHLYARLANRQFIYTLFLLRHHQCAPTNLERLALAHYAAPATCTAPCIHVRVSPCSPCTPLAPRRVPMRILVIVIMDVVISSSWMPVYTHTHTRIYMCIHTHTHTYIHISIYIHPSIHPSIHIYIYMYIYAPALARTSNICSRAGKDIAYICSRAGEDIIYMLSRWQGHSIHMLSRWQGHLIRTTQFVRMITRTIPEHSPAFRTCQRTDCENHK